MNITPKCFLCRHYKGNGQCNAYKDIPIEIMANQHDHRQPFKGDNGIRFEPIKDTRNG